MPERARGLDLLDRGDRAVDGHQQRACRAPPGARPSPRAARSRPGAVGQVPVDVGAQRAQRAHAGRRRADAVDVVVAVDGDPRARRMWRSDQLDRLVDPGERGGGASSLGGQERARARRLARAPGARAPARARRSAPSSRRRRATSSAGQAGISKRQRCIHGESTGAPGRNRAVLTAARSRTGMQARRRADAR